MVFSKNAVQKLERIKMKAFVAAIAVLTLMGHYCIYSHSHIKDLEVQLNFADQKEKIDNDQIRDLMDQVRQVNSQQEVIKAQGYVAGILDGIKREDHYMTIWHDGYNRGSEVRQQVAEAFLKRDESSNKEIIIETKDAK